MIELDRRAVLGTGSALWTPLLITSGEFGDASGSVLGILDVRSFGAKADGVADDTIPLQRAIDASQKLPYPGPILVTGPLRISRPLIVDRPADQSKTALKFLGVGPRAGFIADAAVTLFDSTLKHDSEPRSEYLTFDGIRFEATATGPPGLVISGNFLRVKFVDCEFEGIRCLSARTYAQEWHFSRCTARRWPGTFFKSEGAYAVTASGCKFQNGGTVFDLADLRSNTGVVGCSFHQSSLEGSVGGLLRAALVRGLSIAGIYSEGNANPTFDFRGRGTNQGIAIQGCMFAPQEQTHANVSWYDIEWGSTEAAHSSGNFSSGRLHGDGPNLVEGIHVLGDYATVRLRQSMNNG